MENREDNLRLILDVKRECGVTDTNSQVRVFISELHTDWSSGNNWSGEGYTELETTLHSNITNKSRDISVGSMLVIKEWVGTYLELINQYNKDFYAFLLDNATEIEVIEPEGESVENAIIVEWSYEKYVGYCRNYLGLRYGKQNETEKDLVSGNEESTFKSNESVLLTASQIEGLTTDEIFERIWQELDSSYWKWNSFKNNPTDKKIQEFLGICVETEE